MQPLLFIPPSILLPHLAEDPAAATAATRAAIVSVAEVLFLLTLPSTSSKHYLPLLHTKSIILTIAVAPVLLLLLLRKEVVAEGKRIRRNGRGGRDVIPLFGTVIGAADGAGAAGASKRRLRRTGSSLARLVGVGIMTRYLGGYCPGTGGADGTDAGRTVCGVRRTRRKARRQ
eukprot:evm.model.NODE_46753_length_11038_cov_23.072023.2